MIFPKLTFSSFFVFWDVLGLSGKPFWLRFGSSWGDLGAILAILGRLGVAKIQSYKPKTNKSHEGVLVNDI